MPGQAASRMPRSSMAYPGISFQRGASTLCRAISRTLCGLCLAGALGAQPAGTWLYINSFHSGTLSVWDLGSGKFVHKIRVEESSGSIGAAISSDGKRLFVVDGNETGRLRIFDAAS